MPFYTHSDKHTFSESDGAKIGQMWRKWKTAGISALLQALQVEDARTLQPRGSTLGRGIGAVSEPQGMTYQWAVKAICEQHF